MFRIKQSQITMFINGMAIIIIGLFFNGSVWAINYNVGPGQSLEELDEVPWLDLQAGDTVNIYYRASPYRTKIGLRAQGTAQQPVTIRGILGQNGERPIVSGENATTPQGLAQAGFFSEQYDEGLAVFLIKRSSSDDYFLDKPKYITIENLEIRGASELYTFTNSNNVVTNYEDGAAPIWVVVVDNLIVRNCELTDSGNGLFILSKAGGANQVSHDILVEKNHIHGNGSTGDRADRHHNIYTQTSGITFQYNHIGRLRPGAEGSALKDRSGGTVIRYNLIETGARVIDLVDSEDAGDYLVPRESELGRALNAEELDRLDAYRNSYIYGNLIVNDCSDQSTACSTNMVHYGGDSTLYDLYRKGVLHFYNNTVYIDSDTSYSNGLYYMRLLDVETNEESVSLKNNIIYQNGNSSFSISDSHGQVSFDSVNWIIEGWSQFRTAGDPGASVTIANGVTLIEGTSPCFNDPSNFDFSLDTSSECIDAGTSDLGDISLDKMYLAPNRSQARFFAGSAIDLGAFEDHSTLLTGVPSPPQNLQIVIQN